MNLLELYYKFRIRYHKRELRQARKELVEWSVSFKDEVDNQALRVREYTEKLMKVKK